MNHSDLEVGDIIDDDDGDDECTALAYTCPICPHSSLDMCEFMKHLGASKHQSAMSQRQLALGEGDMYCSVCITAVHGSYDEHCSTSEEHIQLAQSLGLCFPDSPKPILKKNKGKGKKGSSKSTSLNNKNTIIARKCIGLSHLHKKENGEWFCDVCLEKFTCPIEVHCKKAMHAIEMIKKFDPETAFMIKTSASNEKLRKNVRSLISTKVEELFEAERETPGYLRFLLLLDCHDKDIKKEEISEEGTESATASRDEHLGNKTTPECNPSEPQCIKESDDSLTQFSDNQPQDSQRVSDESANFCEIDSIGGDQMDSVEMVSLFEEEDRTAFPIVTSKYTDMDAISRETPPPTLIGLKYLRRADGCFNCSLCEVKYMGSSLSACVKHLTHSLHLRNVINVHSSHPVPDYLLQIRGEDGRMYFKLLEEQARQIERAEKSSESEEEAALRKELLGDCVDECIDGEGLKPEHDLVKLAETWYAESLNKESDKVNIAPDLSTTPARVLVGVNHITHTGQLSFVCTLCNMKFSINEARGEKHHVHGQVHRKKSLIAAYGEGVAAYLQSKAEKEGFVHMKRIIDEACVTLERAERASEGQECRAARAQFLGVDVDKLSPISGDCDGMFDIKKASEVFIANKAASKQQSLNSSELKFPVPEKGTGADLMDAIRSGEGGDGAPEQVPCHTDMPQSIAEQHATQAVSQSDMFADELMNLDYDTETESINLPGVQVEATPISEDNGLTTETESVLPGKITSSWDFTNFSKSKESVDRIKGQVVRPDNAAKTLTLSKKRSTSPRDNPRKRCSKKVTFASPAKASTQQPPNSHSRPRYDKDRIKSEQIDEDTRRNGQQNTLNFIRHEPATGRNRDATDTVSYKTLQPTVNPISGTTNQSNRWLQNQIHEFQQSTCNRTILPLANNSGNSVFARNNEQVKMEQSEPAPNHNSWQSLAPSNCVVLPIPNNIGQFNQQRQVGQNLHRDNNRSNYLQNGPRKHHWVPKSKASPLANVPQQQYCQMKSAPNPTLPCAGTLPVPIPPPFNTPPPNLKDIIPSFNMVSAPNIRTAPHPLNTVPPPQITCVIPSPSLNMSSAIAQPHQTNCSTTPSFLSIPSQYSTSLGVDLNTMKNNTLSSALAKVTDIAPISKNFMNPQIKLPPQTPLPQNVPFCSNNPNPSYLKFK